MAVSGGAEADGRTSTPLLGGIPLPLIPGISEDAGERLGGAHELLVFITLAILVLHVAAARKHQIQRHRAAGRLPPFRTPGEQPLGRAPRRERECQYVKISVVAVSLKTKKSINSTY